LFEELECRGFQITGAKGRGKWMTWVVAQLQA